MSSLAARLPPLGRAMAELVDDAPTWGASARGACVRARVFDDHVGAFLAAHPGGTVVELGAGLHTRFGRLDNGRARWFGLEPPAGAALRRRAFDEHEHERRTMLVGSVLDTDWLDAVAQLPGPYCFVAEAVLLDLDAAEAERALRVISRRFPGAWLVMDTMPAEDPGSLRPWGLELVESVALGDVSPTICGDIPLLVRLAFSLAPRRVQRQVASRCRVSRFVLRPQFDPG